MTIDPMTGSGEQPFQPLDGDGDLNNQSHHLEQVHEIGDSYAGEPRLRDMRVNLWNFPRMILLGLIRLYQMTFSRLLPSNTCRFYPSCSHYGYQAIYKYGVIKGGWMAAWRVIRCNPFTEGGFDPVP